MKQCKYCNIILNEETCYKSDLASNAKFCKFCRNKNYKNNITKEKQQIYTKIKNLKLKKNIIHEYGGKCECCGEDIWQFLTIDHINGKGGEHRKELNGTNARAGVAFYRWLIKKGCPKNNYRLLCMNCNCCKGFHGFCEHEITKYKNNCFVCNKELNKENQFYLYNINNISMCKDCVTCYGKKYIPTIKNNTVKYVKKNNIIKNRGTLHQRRKHGKAKTLNYRQKLIDGFGKRCVCCGETNALFLTVDHINNNGAEERKTNNMYNFYRWLIKNNYPSNNYQLLCYNCNCCKGYYKKCYHTLLKELNTTHISINEYKSIIKNKYII